MPVNSKERKNNLKTIFEKTTFEYVAVRTLLKRIYSTAVWFLFDFDDIIFYFLVAEISYYLHSIF